MSPSSPSSSPSCLFFSALGSILSCQTGSQFFTLNRRNLDGEESVFGISDIGCCVLAVSRRVRASGYQREGFHERLEQGGQGSRRKEGTLGRHFRAEKQRELYSDGSQTGYVNRENGGVRQFHRIHQSGTRQQEGEQNRCFGD